MISPVLCFFVFDSPLLFILYIHRILNRKRKKNSAGEFEDVRGKMCARFYTQVEIPIVGRVGTRVIASDSNETERCRSKCGPSEALTRILSESGMEFH